MNILAAGKALANFGGRNVAGDGGENMHRRFAQHDGIGVGRLVAAEFFGRDDEPERVDAEAGAAGDNEIAGIEQGFVIFPGGNFEKLIDADDEVKMIVGVLSRRYFRTVSYV